MRKRRSTSIALFRKKSVGTRLPPPRRSCAARLSGFSLFSGRGPAPCRETTFFCRFSPLFRRRRVMKIRHARKRHPISCRESLKKRVGFPGNLPENPTRNIHVRSFQPSRRGSMRSLPAHAAGAWRRFPTAGPRRCAVQDNHTVSALSPLRLCRCGFAS